MWPALGHVGAGEGGGAAAVSTGGAGADEVQIEATVQALVALSA